MPRMFNPRLARIVPPMPPARRRQMGDTLTTDVGAGANLLSSLDTLITGAPSTTYTPTTVSSVSNYLPYLVIGGLALWYFTRK